MFNFAFCNDCDLMTWEGYKNVHNFLDDLGMPAGDSFWLFDPSGGDMALFTHDLQHPGPCHDKLLEEINNGNLDVLHSVGSYGARFNGGFSPSRELTIGALDYLKKNAKIPKIWTNHGDNQNIQNIGGKTPLLHHRGDDPTSQCFIIDVLLEYGFEFFWSDSLFVRSANTAYKILAEEICRSGHKIKTFSRFMGDLAWSPNATNIVEQINLVNIDFFRKNRQDIVLYQHWGCHHTPERYAFSPEGMPLSESSMNALKELANLFHKNELKINRLYDLLVENLEKEFCDEAQRIGQWAVEGEKSKQDCFYYNQYGKHNVNYFNSRISNLGVSGDVALDAGCGVGQWSLALLKNFKQVYGVDINPGANEILLKISNSLRQNNLSFSSQDITKLTFANGFFDFINCYSVIFSVNLKIALQEFYRVLKPGGILYVSLNADGWYEHLVDERFKDSSDEQRKNYVIPLWNATFSRIGGAETLIYLSDRAKKLSGGRCYMPRDFLKKVFPEEYFKKYKNVFEHYSDFTIKEIMNLTIETINKFTDQGFCVRRANSFGFAESVLAMGRVKKIIGKINKIWGSRFVKKNDFQHEPLAVYSQDEDNYYCPNRAYLPSEIEPLAIKLGFVDFQWATDALLSIHSGEKINNPIYESSYKGQLSVWEFLIRKPEL